MSKVKVLVVPSDRSGVGKFRSVDPHIFLQNQYPEEFHVDIVYEPPYEDINFWTQYQIVAFHRSIGQDFDKANRLIQMLNSLGVVTVCDIDDYWMPGKEHPIHDIIRVNKINEKIVANLKVAKYVTTTTTIFADEIKKYNKNVFVFPNAINPNEAQFKEKTEESDRVRVGWLGGSSHLHDIQLLDSGFSKITGLKDKVQYVLCGFDTRGTVTEINAQTKEQTKRNIYHQKLFGPSTKKYLLKISKLFPKIIKIIF
jgi:glycosyltransferase involved in cell wall biosynthesis